MLDKLEAIKQRRDDVELELTNPEVLQDMKRYAQLNKEYKDLGLIVTEYLRYKNVVSNIESNKDILANEKDQELREMAKEEVDLLLPEKEELEAKIRLMLIPKEEGDEIYLIGTQRNDINSSEYLHKICGIEYSPAPHIN